jgi:hypothetical protein
MPIYHYQCLYCENGELRVAGVNDHMTICTICGNLMLRSAEDLFWPLFDIKSGSTETEQEFHSLYDD